MRRRQPSPYFQSGGVWPQKDHFLAYSITKLTALALASTTAVALPGAAQAASLIGNDVSCESSSSLFDCSAETATIGDGAEFELVEGFGFGSNLLADFSGDSLNIRANPNNFGGITFGGSSPAIVTFANLTDAFTSAMLTGADSAGRFTQDDITLTDGQLSIDLNGINFRPGDGGISLGVSTMAPTAAVPEPGTWALMLLGFAFVGGMMRTRTTRRVGVTYS
ncbi:MAG: PEPxxWA-CTERM sorting domain-containing protein [Pontixanthobacter sp.]